MKTEIMWNDTNETVLLEITRVFRTTCALFMAVLCGPSERESASTSYKLHV